MSFYRSLIAAVAAMGLATSVLAADDNANLTQNPSDTTPTLQTADASSTTTQQTTQTTTSTDQTQEKVNVNTATVKQLAKVRGLSQSKARAIVSYRKKHGEFKSLDELKNVKGFKKTSSKSMRKLEDQLTTG